MFDHPRAKPDQPSPKFGFSLDHAFRRNDVILSEVASCGYGEFSTFRELLASGKLAAAADRAEPGGDLLEIR